MILVVDDDKNIRLSLKLILERNGYEVALAEEPKEAMQIDRYIADHPPVETFPRFYLVLLRQPIAPMESDGMSRVYQM